MNPEISSRHEELIAALYDVREHMPEMTLEERVIVEMAIMLLEDLPEYEGGENAWSGEGARRSKIRWTRDEYLRLICARGFELIEGRLIPRL
jgi:hypothetical protein